MDFDDTAEEAAWRTQCREFLSRHAELPTSARECRSRTSSRILLLAFLVGWCYGSVRGCGQRARPPRLYCSQRLWPIFEAGVAQLRPM